MLVRYKATPVTKLLFCFCRWFSVPIRNQKQGKKWHPVFESLQNSKMEVHFWNPKTTSKLPFLFLFLIGSCQEADQKSIGQNLLAFDKIRDFGPKKYQIQLFLRCGIFAITILHNDSFWRIFYLLVVIDNYLYTFELKLYNFFLIFSVFNWIKIEQNDNNKFPFMKCIYSSCFIWL